MSRDGQHRRQNSTQNSFSNRFRPGTYCPLRKCPAHNFLPILFIPSAELFLVSAPAGWCSTRRWLLRLIPTRLSAAVLAGSLSAALRKNVTMALSFPASRTAPPTRVLAGAYRTNSRSFESCLSSKLHGLLHDSAPALFVIKLRFYGQQ